VKSVKDWRIGRASEKLKGKIFTYTVGHLFFLPCVGAPKRSARRRTHSNRIFAALFNVGSWNPKERERYSLRSCKEELIKCRNRVSTSN
ncbi:hypothetical protein CpipJ_CPIJ012511, partial [Culex quinquefasciatus]